VNLKRKQKIKNNTMLITELLKENTLPKPTSKLASAPSINDEPSDEVVDEPEDTEVDDGGDLDAVLAVAGDLGDDLYSVLAFNISNDFDDVKLVNKVATVLRDLPGTEDYLAQNTSWIADNKIVPVLIVNGATGEVAEFYSGVNTNELTGTFKMTPLQRTKLKAVLAAGGRYGDAVSNTDWVAGESPSDEGVYDALDDLKDALSLNEIVDVVKRVRVSAEQEKRNKARSTQNYNDLKSFGSDLFGNKENSAGRDLR
jgi:hypothetical protein